MVLVEIQNKDKLDFAIRLFKKKTQKEGIVKEAKLRESFEKPCIKKKRKAQESRARNKKNKKMLKVF
ncbi:MAG: 30S ribosomal protein S21 [Rickettsiales bacterium]|jgi:small subunit ribosomal protein S21|nr:30S ribosomal protein S21 [Rickettsiales bacterium]